MGSKNRMDWVEQFMNCIDVIVARFNFKNSRYASDENGKKRAKRKQEWERGYFDSSRIKLNHFVLYIK